MHVRVYRRDLRMRCGVKQDATAATPAGDDQLRPATAEATTDASWRRRSYDDQPTLDRLSVPSVHPRRWSSSDVLLLLRALSRRLLPRVVGGRRRRVPAARPGTRWGCDGPILALGPGVMVPQWGCRGIPPCAADQWDVMAPSSPRGPIGV